MTRGATKVPGAVIVGLVLAIILDTFIQITWKLSVTGLPPGTSLADSAGRVLASPWFYAAMAGFVAQLYNWVRVLARADLSFAQPFTALSYLTVLAISGSALHEHLSVTRVFGVALILVGVFCISRTPHRTPPAEPGRPRAFDAARP